MNYHLGFRCCKTLGSGGRVAAPIERRGRGSLLAPLAPHALAGERHERRAHAREDAARSTSATSRS